MKQFDIRVWLICFALCLTIGYLFIRNTESRMYRMEFIHDHGISRIDFLNKTFCGKFINGIWQTTINQSQIVERNQFLELQIKHWELQYVNLPCTEFIENNGFYSKHITDLEYKNPMAFSILVYKNLYQFQVLMRTLYVRSNVHCIHVDKGAPAKFYTYALKLSTCLENVYVVSSRIKVSWGTMSILEAERLCQSYLLKQSSKWHYYMTIAGTELPIQTNLNRIQILQLAPDKSRNDVSSFPQPFNRQASKKTPPPGNMTVYKGEFHSILTRDFIQAVHTNPLTLEFWTFLNGTSVPDEQFYPSLVRLSELPGGKARVVSTYEYMQLLSHYKIWGDTPGLRCESGKFHSSVCQFNYKDLANIDESGRLFANKFNQDLDLVGIDCWEQWIHVKQTHHQDIDCRKYVDKYPFTKRREHMNFSQSSTTKTNMNLLISARKEKTY